MHRLSLALVIASLLFTSPSHAGLRFEPHPGPQGADAASLAADGSTLWVGTARGVWRLSSGAFAFDGLGDQTIASVAVADGTVFAATGERLFRRGGDGAYALETLPGANPFPSVLLGDGTTVYAGGLGVYRRQGGAWTALPSPGGGLVTALTTLSGDLVAGLSTGGAARFNGTSWTGYSAGFGLGESTSALVVAAGTLYAASDRRLYSWNGSAWVVDTAFGSHDVRALTYAGGTLRAATSDAGVVKKTGAAWSNDNVGLVVSSARSFTVVGSDLHLGTAGGPVYRLGSGGWVEAGTGLDAATISSVRATEAGLAVASRGGGLVTVSGGVVSGPRVTSGCGDVFAVALEGGTTVAATGCGPFAGAGVSLAPAATGLPAGTLVTTLAETGVGLLGGTTNGGVYRFFGGVWSQDSDGLPLSVGVSTLRQTGPNLFAGAGGRLFVRQPNATWADASSGLPAGASVLALAGGNPAFLGLAGGGTFRKDGTSSWRQDSAGLTGAPVFALEQSAARLFSSVGPSGVFQKADGGWMRDGAGLPAGADVRALRAEGTRLYAGTAGHGLHVASTVATMRTIPVVLDVVGGTGARFRTELTLGNRGATAVDVTISFAGAPGFGGAALSGSVSKRLAPGAELRAPDALEFLRDAGLALPQATPSSPVAGSLSLSASGVADDLYAIARTYTRDASGGSYGLFYDAPSDLDAPEDEASVYGLRSVAGVSRSNLAVVHLPGRGEAPIELSVQVFSASGTASGPPLTKSLAPGEWYQWSGILGLAGLPEGSFGYARITRTSGVGAFTAYGIVNDAATSDGSYLPAFRPGGLAAGRRLVVPVVLDVYGVANSHFTTELTLVNDGPIGTPVDLIYRPAPGFGSSQGAPVVTLPSLGARSQTTIPDVIQFLRERGVVIPDPRIEGPQAGTLDVSFRFLGNLDSPRTIALARTSTPNPDTQAGGTFGLFYPAAARGGGARTSAFVPALTQDATVRSNLAVVHLGGGSDLSIDLRVQLFDASTGQPVGNVLTLTLQPGDWYQWSNVLSAAGALATTSKAYAVVTRTSGDDTFLAYGVLNDASTSDGSYLAMQPKERY